MARRTDKLDDTSLKNYGQPTGESEKRVKSAEANTKQTRKTNYNSKSALNLKPRQKDSDKRKKALMQLDITGYKDYLYRMAKLKQVSRAKYVRNLIKKDYEENLTKYQALRILEEYNPPEEEE